VVVQVTGSGAGAGGHTWFGGHAGVATPDPEQLVTELAWQTIVAAQSASTLHDAGWQVISGTVAVVVPAGLVPEAGAPHFGWPSGQIGGVASTEPVEPVVPWPAPLPAPVG
jgi:hypothetical protein